MSELDIEAYLRAKGVTTMSLLPNKVVLTVPYPPPLRGSKLAQGATLEEALSDLDSLISEASIIEKSGFMGIQEAYTVKEVELWISAKLEEISEDYYNCDNFRFALVGDIDQMKRYERQQNNSCCEFFDEIYRGPDDKKYMLGFNHGH